MRQSSKSPITAWSATFSKSCLHSLKSCRKPKAHSWTANPRGILTRATMIENYKTILYRQDDGSWVAEIPAISECYALMETREAALAELAEVFKMIAEEY